MEPYIAVVKLHLNNMLHLNFLIQQKIFVLTLNFPHPNCQNLVVHCIDHLILPVSYLLIYFFLHSCNDLIIYLPIQMQLFVEIDFYIIKIHCHCDFDQINRYQTGYSHIFHNYAYLDHIHHIVQMLV